MAEPAPETLALPVSVSLDIDPWGVTVAPARLDTCQAILPLVHKRTGGRGQARKRCWCYACLERCGPERVNLHLQDAREHFSEHEVIYHDTVAKDEATSQRFKKRLSRASGQFIAIARDDGMISYFSNVDFSGRLPPHARPVTQRVAAAIARHRLRLPGVVKVTSSRGWPLSGNGEPKGTGDWARLHAPVSAGTHRAAEKEMRRLYAERGGQDWPAHATDPLDYTPQEATDLYVESLANVTKSGTTIGTETGDVYAHSENGDAARRDSPGLLIEIPHPGGRVKASGGLLS